LATGLPLEYSAIIAGIVIPQFASPVIQFPAGNFNLQAGILILGGEFHFARREISIPGGEFQFASRDFHFHAGNFHSRHVQAASHARA
jgi:hypothetical protein